MERGTRNVERELKLSADLDFEIPDLRTLGYDTIQLPQETLRTSYFDTVDLRLWRRGITLRHRDGEEGAVGTWTMKLPRQSAEGTLDRTELSWPGTAGRVPPEVDELLRGIVRRARLERVALLEATRRRVAVRSRGAALGEIDDDLVTVASGRRTGYAFRQIEFEFATDQAQSEADAPVVEAMLDAMEHAGARPDREQKFAKSLGLSQRREESLPSLSRKSPLGAVVRTAIAGGFEQIADFDVALRLESADPPRRAVHQARVATRRLRSTLKTFGPVLDPVWLRHVRSDLKWLGNVLGQVRDADVLAQGLVGDSPITPLEAVGQSQLLARLTTQRRRCSEELDAALRSDRYLNLLDHLHAASSAPPFWVSSPPGTSGGARPGPDTIARDALPRLVRDHWKKLRREVRNAGATPSDAQLHRIRIRSKQLRYAAEAAEPAIGKGARRTARRAEALQGLLGEHHDSVNAEAWLRELPAHATPEQCFVAGVKTSDERRRQARLRNRWEHAWGALRSPGATRWLV